MQLAGNMSDILGCALALADIYVAQGRLHAAMRTFVDALQLVRDRGVAGLRGTADMHVGMSELLLERNDLDAALQQLLMSQELGELAGLPQTGTAGAWRWLDCGRRAATSTARSTCSTRRTDGTWPTSFPMCGRSLR
jgi:hypothetical protein